MEKRTWFYIQKPNEHEIASCSCGNHKTQWSEYSNHLWCDICNKDFIPKHNGIFDGPIAFNAARLLGITFDRYNLLTNEIESVDEYAAEVGIIRYLVCHKIKDIFAKKVMPIDIKYHVFENEKKITIKNGIMSFSNGLINIKLEEEIPDSKIESLSTTFKFEYPRTETFNLKLNLNDDKKSFSIEENKDLEKFRQFMIVHELNNDLETNNKIKKVKKI